MVKLILLILVLSRIIGLVKMKRYFLILLLIIFTPLISHSATLTWYLVDSQTAVLVLDTESEKINTVQAELSGPALVVKKISDANSLINFWIQEPKIPRDPVSGSLETGSRGTTLTFAGIIPSGYQGEGVVLTIIGDNFSLGKLNSLSLLNSNILRNDGEGSAVKVKLKQAVAGAPTIWVKSSNQTSAPEIFEPQIMKSKTLPTDNYYLTFGTQDKNSGVAYYAVYESIWPILNIAKQNLNLAWIKTTSPYELKNQTLRHYIYVKAVNQNGGVRIMRLSPQFSIGWLYEHWLISLIMIVVICLVLIL